MKKIAALTLALAASYAQAVPYNMSMSGSGITFVDGNVLCCSQQPVSFSWSGLIHVDVNSSADGTYSGAALQGFAARGSLDSPTPYAVFGFSFAPPPSYYWTTDPSVTVQGGRITDVRGSWHDGFSNLSGTFAGMSFGSESFAWHAGHTIANGGLSVNTVAVSPVPEPETYALLLAGLGVLQLIRRRNAKGA